MVKSTQVWLRRLFQDEQSLDVAATWRRPADAAAGSDLLRREHLARGGGLALSGLIDGVFAGWYPAPVDETPDAEHGQAAELLSQWRSAERDTAAARAAESIAALAVEAAEIAETAAAQAEKAADVAMQAAIGAKDAAALARQAASEAAKGALSAGMQAAGEEARASQDVSTAEDAEGLARDRFQEAQSRGFQKDRSDETGPA